MTYRPEPIACAVAFVLAPCMAIRRLQRPRLSGNARNRRRGEDSSALTGVAELSNDNELAEHADGRATHAAQAIVGSCGTDAQAGVKMRA